LAPESDPLYQPVHIQIGAGCVERRHARAVQLQKHADPLPGLGGNLRRLGGRRQGRHHVELAAPRDLRAPSDVHRAQVDRGPGKRPDDGGGIARIDQEAQPGQYVADLGPLEERRLAHHPMRDCPLLKRHGDGLTVVDDARDEDRDGPGLHPLSGNQPLDV
jgi:hypothetical protein